MLKTFKIALDGPAGAGKSSISKIVSKRLNFEYLDSGAFYRAITKIILDSGIKIDDYIKIADLLDKIKFDLKEGRVFVNNRDLTDYLRTKEVTLNVSPVSSIIPVRLKVNKFLNKYSEGKSIIMDGRDIGTVVFPDADFKFYLDASVDIRALRRFNEKTTDMSLDSIKDNIIKRDENDKNKEFGALKIAENAVYIDTTGMSIDEVVEKIIVSIKRED